MRPACRFGRLAQTFVSHSLTDFGARKVSGRDFRGAAENRTPAACAPRAAAPHSTSTSEFGLNKVSRHPGSSVCVSIFALLSAGPARCDKSRIFSLNCLPQRMEYQPENGFAVKRKVRHENN